MELNGTKFGIVMAAIMEERHRQEELKDEGRFKYTCSDEQMGNLDRLACMDEETGEVARECLELRNLVMDRPRHEQPDNEKIKALEKELIQVAAIVIAWLESPMNAVPRMVP